MSNGILLVDRSTVESIRNNIIGIENFALGGPELGREWYCLKSSCVPKAIHSGHGMKWRAYAKRLLPSPYPILPVKMDPPQECFLFEPRVFYAFC